MENLTSFFNNFEPSKIINFILYPQFEGNLFWLRLIFIVLSIIFLTAFLALFFANSWIKYRATKDLVEFFTYRPVGAKKTLKQWMEITKRLDSNREAEYKLAVIESESLLEEALDRMDYKGETMTDKLKQVNPTILPNIEQIKKAHKIRNKIVHEPDYHLTLEEAKKTIGIYEEALRTLELF